MNVFRFVLSLIITISILIALNISIAGKPAFGKLLNPVSGFWQNAETKALHIDAKINKLSLNEEVEVYFDENRIPHIFAQNEYDLYFAQGYVTASLRLWQMEFQVLAAEGRVSEVLGNDPKYLAFDKMQRKKGLKYGALNKEKNILKDPLAKELVHSYADGVNAYINSLSSKDLPLEYKLIGFKPQPWSVLRTALFLMNMSDVLTNTEYDIENSNFIFQYGSDLFEQMHKQWYTEVEPIIETPEGGWLVKFKMDSASLFPDTLVLPNTNPEEESNISLSKLQPKPDVQIGSNNWALSGEKTASSYPLLANDPHLRLTFPSVWLEMHLVGPQTNTYGVSFPGAPSIIIGYNEKIGWGVTNAGRDVKDWYVIEYKDESREYYKWKNGWKPTEKVVEEFKIKGSKSVFDTIIYTHLGPVTHENFQTKAGKVNLAMQWTAHLGTEEYKTFYLLNRAENHEQYLEALNYYSCPAQNFVFASVNGDIALKQQGLFPVLDKNEGRTIEDGSVKEEWSNFIPFDQNPQQFNPQRGFVSSANQHAVDTTYPYYTNGVFEYYRNRVINEELRGMRRATVEDMIALQYNNYNLLAAENLPVLMIYLRTFKMNFKEQEIYELLNSWDFHNNADDIASTYFQIFYERFYTLLWDEFVEVEANNSWENFKQKEGLKAPNEFATYKMITDTNFTNPFIKNADYPELNSLQDIVVLALKHTAERVEKLDQGKLEWGKYKNTLIEHLAMLPAFSRNVNSGGNYKVVNATGNFHGPSWRMILDFDKGEIKGLGIYPGGQSGNPGSYYYDNFVDPWVAAQYRPLFNSGNKNDFQNNNFKKVTLSK